VRLNGTIVIGSTAYAVYSTDPRPLAQLWESDEISVCGKGIMLFSPALRLVAVGDEPAPEVLPADLSASLHDGGNS
jgi:hypothetical protein